MPSAFHGTKHSTVIDREREPEILEALRTSRDVNNTSRWADRGRAQAAGVSDSGVATIGGLVQNWFYLSAALEASLCCNIKAHGCG